MSSELAPRSDLSPAERISAEIEDAKAAGDLGRVLDGIEGLDAIQRFLKRRNEQREIVNQAGAEKVRTERWIGLCILNGQVHKPALKDLDKKTVSMFRQFARASEDVFEQAIRDVADSPHRTVTSNSVARELRLRLDPDSEKRREETARRRDEERRLLRLGRRELDRQLSRKHAQRRARPLEVALGAIQDALRALEEFDVHDENERVAYDEALRMLHGAEDFVKIAAGHVHGAPREAG